MVILRSKLIRETPPEEADSTHSPGSPNSCYDLTQITPSPENHIGHSGTSAVSSQFLLRVRARSSAITHRSGNPGSTNSYLSLPTHSGPHGSGLYVMQFCPIANFCALWERALFTFWSFEPHETHTLSRCRSIGVTYARIRL
jgi:hypothetical protein